MKRLLALLLLMASTAFAFDSSTAFNVVTMSYTANTSIYQRIVLDANQKTQTTINFSVDVKNGGGRPTHDLNGVPQAYSTQTDTATVTIKVFDHSGGLIGSQTSGAYILKNWGSNPGGWSARPGDNLQPWTTASIAYNGDLTYARWIEVWMTGTDGAWWAGNYGPEWRTPTVTIGSSAQNVVYNPEFGISPNSQKAQGWFNTGNTWASCGVTSGNAVCVTAENGVTANMWGGGYDANGGSLSGAAGGYTSVLSTTTADTAATTGDPTGETTAGGGGSTAPTLCCGGSASSFNANPEFVSRVQNFINRNTADTQVYIEQIGNSNTITVQQTGTKNNYVDYFGNGSFNNVTINQSGTAATQVNYIEMHLGTTTTVANSNTVSLTQQSDGGGKGIISTVTGSGNSLTIQQKDSGSHYAEVNLSGGSKTVDVLQQGSANHMASIFLSGAPTTLSLTQSGSTQQFYSINHTCATAGGCAAITVTQGN